MGSMTLFDLVMFLALFGMFILGYAQGLTRRLLGIAAILFSLVVLEWWLRATDAAEGVPATVAALGHG